MCPVTYWLVDALGARCLMPCIKHNCSSRNAETLYESCSKYAPRLQSQKKNIDAGKVAVNYKPVDAIYMFALWTLQTEEEHVPA